MRKNRKPAGKKAAGEKIFENIDRRCSDFGGHTRYSICTANRILWKIILNFKIFCNQIPEPVSIQVSGIRRETAAGPQRMPAPWELEGLGC